MHTEPHALVFYMGKESLNLLTMKKHEVLDHITCMSHIVLWQQELKIEFFPSSHILLDRNWT